MYAGRVVVALAVLATAPVLLAQAKLKPGTRIKLTVQRTLSTCPKGGVLGVVGVKPITRENTLVIYEVAEDVLDEQGVLVIPAGSPATGTVVDSQVGGGIKPHAPRLATTVERVLAADGSFIPLQFETSHEGKFARVFNRSETGAFVQTLHGNSLDRVFQRPENSGAIRELFELIVHGNVGEMFRHPEKALKLQILAERSGITTLARYVQMGKIYELASLVAEIQSGRFVLRGLVDVGRLLDAYKLMDETWRAGDQLINWLSGRLKAPQVTVPAGFPVEAIVANPSQ